MRSTDGQAVGRPGTKVRHATRAPDPRGAEQTAGHRRLRLGRCYSGDNQLVSSHPLGVVLDAQLPPPFRRPPAGDPAPLRALSTTVAVESRPNAPERRALLLALPARGGRQWATSCSGRAAATARPTRGGSPTSVRASGRVCDAPKAATRRVGCDPGSARSYGADCGSDVGQSRLRLTAAPGSRGPRGGVVSARSPNQSEGRSNAAPTEWRLSVVGEQGRFLRRQGRHRAGCREYLSPRALSSPRSWAERANPNLIYFNEVEKGNHFAA